VSKDPLGEDEKEKSAQPDRSERQARGVSAIVDARHPAVRRGT